MTSGDEELAARIGEFAADARKLVGNGEEALNYLAEGNLQSACDVISISHYALGQVSGDYDGILEAFEKRGIRPGEKR